MKIFLVALFYVLIVSFGYSQKVQLFDKEGSTIPKDDLWGIALDNQGQKLIGSAHSGFLVFDGKSFNPSPEINGVFISPVFKDSKGNIWICYRGPEENAAEGLIKYIP